MKSALLVCDESVDAMTLLATAGQRIGLEVRVFEGSVQMRDSRDRLLTAFDDAYHGVEDWLSVGLSRFEADGLLTPRAFVIECRWEDLFCEVLQLAAQQTRHLFVIDSEGEVHVGSALDESTVSL